MNQFYKNNSIDDILSQVGKRAKSIFDSPDSPLALRHIDNHLQSSRNESKFASIGISGFITKGSNLIKTWQPLADSFTDSSSYVLEWDSGNILQTSVYLSTAFINRKLFSMLPSTTENSEYDQQHRSGFLGLADKALNNKYVDYSIGTLNKSLENFLGTWDRVRQHAEKSGEELGRSILRGALGDKPLVLIGIDLGSEVIFSALKVLSAENCIGRVSNVIFLGSTVIHNESSFSNSLKPVSGRFLNFYSTKDIFLRYLVFRNGYKDSLLGLKALNGFRDVNNFDITSMIGIDHFKYDKELGSILKVIKR